MDLNNFKVKIHAEVIARYKDWHHFLILINGKFSDVLVIDCSNID